MKERNLRIDLFTVSLFRRFMGICVLLILGSSGTALRAQTVEIRLLNGRNGRPMARKCVNIWVGDASRRSSGPLIEAQTDNEGVVKIRLTTEDAELSDQSQRLVCGLFGVINPVVKYGDTISIRPGYVLCQEHTPGHSWLAMTDFSTKQVLQDGLATANTCGEARALPEHGEVILFVRELNWLEKLRE